MELPGEIPQHPSAWTWTRFTETLARRRAWAGAPFLAIFTLGAAGAFWWPDTYVSTAVMRIVPPATSDRIYPEIARQSLADRLTAFQQHVLSRQNLNAMVDHLRLYRDERARMPLEDVIEKMRRDIEIAPVSAGGGNGAVRNPVFRVSFTYTNRLDAERVTRALMSGILSWRLDSVYQVVRSGHDRAALEVEAAEAKLAAFRRARGKGPYQAGLRLHQLALLETRVSAAEAGLSRARQEQALLEAELQLARAARPEPVAAPPAAPSPAASVVEQLEAERKRLLTRYRDSHPDVERLTAPIDAARLAVPPPPAGTPEPAAPNDRAVRAEAQLRAKRLEVARFENEIAAVGKQLAALKTELDHAPDANATLEQLTREHALAVERQKLLESEASRVGDDWSLGETLEVVDSPTLPESPVAPNRPLIVFLAAVLGLAVGAGAVVAREWNDESLQSIRHLAAIAPACVLGSIPLIENELVVRRRHRMAVVAWASAALMSAAVIGVSVIRYYGGRS